MSDQTGPSIQSTLPLSQPTNWLAASTYLCGDFLGEPTNHGGGVNKRRAEPRMTVTAGLDDGGDDDYWAENTRHLLCTPEGWGGRLTFNRNGFVPTMAGKGGLSI
ncbi:hypothetical protein EsH8_IV_000102 [Colletotrichum jinshuiense]